MLAMICSVVAAAFIKGLLYIILLLGGAYALTTYVKLPNLVDVLIWIAAGGYALLIAVSCATAVAAIITMHKMKRRF